MVYNWSEAINFYGFYLMVIQFDSIYVFDTNIYPLYRNIYSLYLF